MVEKIIKRSVKVAIDSMVFYSNDLFVQLGMKIVCLLYFIMSFYVFIYGVIIIGLRVLMLLIRVLFLYFLLDINSC
jgi:hypothetical protein